jgi:hypothetical protein
VPPLSLQSDGLCSIPPHPTLPAGFIVQGLLCWCVHPTRGRGPQVWAGPLEGRAWAVSLFNRSPGDDSITVSWSDLGVPASLAFAVRCVCEGCLLLSSQCHPAILALGLTWVSAFAPGSRLCLGGCAQGHLGRGRQGHRHWVVHLRCARPCRRPAEADARIG